MPLPRNLKQASIPLTFQSGPTGKAIAEVNGGYPSAHLSLMPASGDIANAKSPAVEQACFAVMF
jgi:hypothetical protein